jgi:hypothetical protein
MIGDGSQGKKRVVEYDDSDNKDEEDEGITGTNNSHAMQVSKD